MVYRVFASLKTSIFILSLMCVLFLIGTIFPQGEDIEEYIKAGGRYISLVKTLNLLDLFVSPLFLFVTALLIINLTVCLYDRLKIFLRIRRRPINFERLKNLPNVMIFEDGDIEEKLKKIGFKIKNTNSSVKIFEKGLPYWWLSWFYHAGIILAIFGFFLTALFAFERDIILYPDKPETISLYSKETRWNKFLERLGKRLPERRRDEEYVLTLRDFKTEYYQGLKIDYPKDIAERIALGIGLKPVEPSSKGFSYMPKMWLTRLDIKKPDGEVVNVELRVNKPYRIGTLTLYQMGYEQRVRLLVKGKPLRVSVREPFKVEEVEGRFMLGILKLGTLFKKDGTREEIIPFTRLYHISDEDPYKVQTLGVLQLGRSLHVKGVVFEFKDYEEASYLSYRKDPGVKLVGIASLFVFVGLFIRCFGAWYRVQYAAEGKTAYVLISTRGILADKDRLIKRLQK